MSNSARDIKPYLVTKLPFENISLKPYVCVVMIIALEHYWLTFYWALITSTAISWTYQNIFGCLAQMLIRVYLFPHFSWRWTLMMLFLYLLDCCLHWPPEVVDTRVFTLLLITRCINWFVFFILPPLSFPFTFSSSIMVLWLVPLSDHFSVEQHNIR